MNGQEYEHWLKLLTFLARNPNQTLIIRLLEDDDAEELYARVAELARFHLQNSQIGVELGTGTVEDMKATIRSNAWILRA